MGENFIRNGVKVLKETHEVEVIFETEGAEKTKKETKDINKVIEENTQDTKQNTKAMEQNTSAQNRNNQSKSKGSKATGEYSSALKGISSKLTLNNLMAMARMITTVAQKTIELSKYSVDYIENLNLMDTAFGKNSQEARKWVDSIANIYGFDESSLTKELGMFRQFGSALGFANDKADLLSKNLTLMAGDISSLYNITFDQASQKLTSALTGQTKAIRSLGADITQASLQQELYNMGINESISNMNRAEKTLLIYLSLERQLANSQGDLAKTLMSPSNQMKVFTEQVHRLARAIGNLLLPVLAAILPIVNGVMAALTELFNLIASLLGFDPIQFDFGGAAAGFDDLEVGVGNVGDALDGVSGSAGKAGKNVDDLKKKLTGLRGFDKLNVIQTPNDTSSGGSGGSGGGGVGGLAGGGINSKLLDALKQYNAHLDLAGDKVKKIRNMILGWFGYTVDENGELVKLHGKLTRIQIIFKLIGGIIKDVYDILKDVVKQTIEWGKTENAKKMFESIGDIIIILLGWVKEITGAIKELYFEYISPIIPDILDALSEIIQYIEDILRFLTPVFKIIKEIIKLNLAGVLTGIGVAIKLIKTAFENMRLTFEYGIKIIKKLVDGDFRGAADLMFELFKKMLENAWNTAKDIFNYIKEHLITKMTEAKDGAIKKLEDIVNWFKELPYRIGVLIGQITAKIIKFFTDPDYRKQIGEKIKEKIINGLVWVTKNADKVITSIKNKLKDRIKNADWSAVGKAIGEVILKSIFFPQYLLSKTVSKLIKGIKAGLSSAGANTTVTTKVGGKTTTSTASMGFRANGGFVDTGQMFIAREAGPELVGTIGNKTAVANNDQIVQAISIGVQRAIEHAGMRNTNVIIEATGDSSGLMNFINYKQKEQTRQYGL